MGDSRRHRADSRHPHRGVLRPEQTRQRHRCSDRHQLDERQSQDRLKVQALVGRVLSAAVAVAYIAASAANTALWPWAVLLGLMAISFISGRLIYGEHLTSRHGSDKTT